MLITSRLEAWGQVLSDLGRLAGRICRAVLYCLAMSVTVPLVLVTLLLVGLALLTSRLVASVLVLSDLDRSEVPTWLRGLLDSLLD